jgi:hypothetical protein
VVGARVTDNLVTLDANGILLDNGGSTRSAAYPRSSGLTFDGSNFVATFIGDGSNGDTQIFATRIAADGHVLDDEPEGLLVHVGEVGPYRALRSTITATATDCIVAWGDTVFQQPEDFNTITNPIFVQHVLAH